MPRAHLSKRLPDADAIQLFAEHHITQVRRRKNGEISMVKHVQFGWLMPETYYQMQKLHDLFENSKFGGLVGDFIRGGYQLKWALANVSVAGVPVIGAGLYGWALARAVTKLVLASTRDESDPLQKLFASREKSEASLLIAGVILPFGEALLLWAIVRNTTNPSGDNTWEELLFQIEVAIRGPPPPPQSPTGGRGGPRPFGP